MADSKSSNSPSGKNVKAPNIFERAMEEFEAVVHNGKNKHEHHKETHGLRDNIDANTPTSGVKAPNVFERAKEEIEAIVEAIHSKKESKGQDSDVSGETRNPGAKNSMKSEKSELHSVVHNGKNKHEHHKETHGLRDDIDANTPTSGVKAPNVFERAKEEIEAIVEAIHSKKESKGQDSDVSGETRNPAEKSGMKSEKSELHSETKGKAPPSLIDKSKEGLKHKPHHHKETHGRSGDISIDEVKAPNVFERAKEEIEAIIDSIHPKKDSGGGGHVPK